MHWVIEFSQAARLKPHIDMNWKYAKYNFKKKFFRFINNAVFGKCKKL